MRIELACFTDRGRVLGERLRAAFEAGGDSARLERCGAGGAGVGEWTARRFAAADALVYVGAVGIAARAIAPHVVSKASDPAVVAMDDAGRFVVAVLSGHLGGANDLAVRAAVVVGAQPVITAATDARGVFSVDAWARRRGMAVINPEAIKTVSARLLAGETVGMKSAFPVVGPLPAGVETASDDDVDLLVDVREANSGSALVLAPPAVVLGVGCKKGVGPEAIGEAFAACCRAAAVRAEAVGLVCSIDLKRGEPGLVEFCARRGLPLRTYGAAELAGAPGEFGASKFVEETVGVGNVCERSAVLGAGGGRLLAGKSVMNGVAVALALRDYAVDFSGETEEAGRGRLFVVGIGPGGEGGMTGRALSALRAADLLAGYDGYIERIRPLFPGKPIFATAMRREAERCRAALDAAASGKTVALVCGGDAGVYGLAGLAHQLAGDRPEVDIEVIPGVSAAMEGAALLGAPLTHDFAVISLSDLLTPWPDIEERLRGAAAADFVICLYNPASGRRRDHLRRACGIVMERRDGSTPCGWVRNAGRPGGECGLLTLAELRGFRADMFTTVFIGSSATREVNGKMVTPRGYKGLEG